MKLTDRQIGDIVGDMVFLVDSREKKNEHITIDFEQRKLITRIEKLDVGDYTFILPNYPELELDRKFVVERKNSLDEICGNFTKDRERFIREFERFDGHRMHLLIEGATWRKIARKSYRSQMHPNSFTASLMTFTLRYNVPAWFVNAEEAGTLIYNILKYELIEHLKKC